MILLLCLVKMFQLINRSLTADKFSQLKLVDDDFKILQQVCEGIWKPKFLSEIDLNTELADLVTKVFGCFSGYLYLDDSEK